MISSEGPKRVLLGVSETCEAIGCRPTTLYKLVADGQIAAVKLGAKTLFHVDEIKRFVDRLAAEAAARAEHRQAKVSANTKPMLGPEARPVGKRAVGRPRKHSAPLSPVCGLDQPSSRQS